MIATDLDLLTFEYEMAQSCLESSLRTLSCFDTASETYAMFAPHAAANRLRLADRFRALTEYMNGGAE